MNVKENRTLIIICSIMFFAFFYQLLAIVYKNNGTIQAINRVALLILIVLPLVFNANNIILKKNDIKKTLMLFLFIYMTVSLGIYFVISRMSIDGFLREMIHSILPFIVYFSFINIENEVKNKLIRTLVYVLTASSLLGLAIYFKLSVPMLNDTLLKISKEYPAYWRISSVYGVIVLGYLAQLVFGLILFKEYKGKYQFILMIFFLCISILTLQRSPIIGIGFAVLVFFFSTFRLKINKRKLKTLATLILVLLTLPLLLSILNSTDMINFDLFSLIDDTINNINFRTDSIIRGHQRVIYNDDSIIKILVGEGFGKYSPNNPNAELVQPDASYYRIFNELGILGMLLFFSTFISFLVSATKEKDYFMIYFILFTLIAFSYNRILWAIPSNYIIFMILGLKTKNNHSKELKKIKRYEV